MAIADELVAVLGYKIEGQENLKRYQDGLDRTEKNAENSAQRLRRLGVAAGALTTAGIAFTTAAVKNFAGFERELTRIGITAGATALETANAAEVVQRMAKDFALPIDQAVAGLDTLVASGLSLDQAMAFLPSVLATAQATGAATEDIANTAIKASSALGIAAGDMQRAFDVMVEGGKAGQFELKDMAKYIPELANSFSSLGYKGEEGLKQLIALLQTLREDTGTASNAATQAQNIFGKMFTEETAKKFSNFGVDLRKEMEAAAAAGEDAVAAFVRISKEAIDGDLTKLPLLFTDQEFRLGMQSLITSQESFDKFIKSVNGAEVDGVVFRDLKTVLGDTQAQMDRMTISWERFMKSFGGAVADPIGGTLDSMSNALDEREAFKKRLEEKGEGGFWNSIRPRSQESFERLAREGGYVPAGNDEAKAASEQTPFAYESLGRRPQRPVSQTPVRLIQPVPLGQARRAGVPAADARRGGEVDSRAGVPAADARRGGEVDSRAGVPAADARRGGKVDSRAGVPAADARRGGEVDSRAGVPAADARRGGEVDSAAQIEAGFENLAARVEAMNSNLANMTGEAPVNATITDARTDARSFPVNTTVNVGGVTVQQAAQAPAAVGAAVGAAAAGAVNSAAAAQPSRMQTGPVE